MRLKEATEGLDRVNNNMRCNFTKILHLHHHQNRENEKKTSLFPQSDLSTTFIETFTIRYISHPNRLCMKRLSYGTFFS